MIDQPGFHDSSAKRISYPMPASAGIVYDMPAEQYHAVPAVSSSLLKRLYVSFPKHVKECAVEPTEAMDDGTAFHSFLLDRDFHSRFFVMPTGPINPTTGRPFGSDSNKYIQWRDSLADIRAGKKPVAADLMSNIEAAYNEFRSHPFGAEIAGRIASKQAKTEVSLFWSEEREEGETFPCKARLDILDRGAVPLEINNTPVYVIRDPKTTRSAHPMRFMWDVRPTKDGLNYWIQAAWYYRGARKCGLDIAGVEFIAIELEPSHGITFHGMDVPELESAQADVLRLAQRWQHCVDTGVFGNYPAVRHMIAIGDDE